MPHVYAPQLRIDLGGDLAGPLGCIVYSFPFAAAVEMYGEICDAPPATERLVACLAALPDRSWPTVEAVSRFSWLYMPAPSVPHWARLCSGLREVSCGAHNGEELAAALEGLAPVAGTLEALRLSLTVYKGIKLDTVSHAAEALGRLGRLRQLQVYWGCTPGAGCLLTPALVSLTSLLSLAVRGTTWAGAPLLQLPLLGLRPGSLKKLEFSCSKMLGALPHMGGVTALRQCRGDSMLARAEGRGPRAEGI